MGAKAAVVCIVFSALAVVFFVKTAPEKGSQGSTLSVSSLLGNSPPQGFERAVKPRQFIFPRDHGPHLSFRTEWWYFTGNLRTGDGRRFGYQLTFFRSGLTPHAPGRLSHWGTNQVYLAHFAVTDVAGKRFLAAERISRGALGLAGAAGEPVVIHLEDLRVREIRPDPWSMELVADEPYYGLHLQTRAETRPVLNGDAGLSRKSGASGNASYYYSIPRMATKGVIRIGNETFPVEGISWFDREWSTSALEPSQAGWDWFALHLDDGRSVMFYRLRRKDGSVDSFSSGTLVRPDGTSTPLAPETVSVDVTGWWKSPRSGIAYPGRWRLSIPREGIDLDIVPLVADQELNTSFRYWEGAVSVTGLTSTSSSGTGYVELTGYDEFSRGNNTLPVR